MVNDGKEPFFFFFGYTNQIYGQAWQECMAHFESHYAVLQNNVITWGSMCSLKGGHVTPT